MDNLNTAKSAKNDIFEELYYLDIFLDGTFVKRQQTMDKIKIRSQNIIEKCNKIIECMNIMETE